MEVMLFMTSHDIHSVFTSPFFISMYHNSLISYMGFFNENDNDWFILNSNFQQTQKLMFSKFVLIHYNFVGILIFSALIQISSKFSM